MPNRILREGILTSDRVNTLSPGGELFYRRLMSVVDDFGRFDARLTMLRSSLFPLRVNDVREADISRWMAECQKAGLIALYAVGDKQYLELLDFRQVTRAKKSRFPDPPDPAMRSTCIADATQTPSRCEAPAYVYTETETETDTETETEAEKTKTVAAQAPPGVRPEVWEAWKRHRGRKLTAEAVRLQGIELQRLSASGDDPNLVLEQSIRNGWSGLFALRNPSGSGPPKPRSPADKRAVVAEAIFGNRSRRDDGAIDGTAERVA